MYMASVRAMNVALQRHTCRCANLAECRCAAVTTLGFMVALVAVLWCMMSWNFPMMNGFSNYFGSAKRSNWKQRHQNHHKIITNLKRKLTTLNWRRIQGTPALNALCLAGHGFGLPAGSICGVLDGLLLIFCWFMTYDTFMLLFTSFHPSFQKDKDYQNGWKVGDVGQWSSCPNDTVGKAACNWVKTMIYTQISKIERTERQTCS